MSVEILPCKNSVHPMRSWLAAAFNMPGVHSPPIATRLVKVLGSGIQANDFANALLVADWTDPVLIMGGYDSGIPFWEPMIPYSFASGTEE